ncbi:DUF4148 domain-containing protein [Caballeronia mineralivorans]|uniref:DUF4148 domain-containing protein n=1 Tax=Caballeronia mineralivorans TaxID=2010198 RepID=UPI00094F4BCE|nr:DUF4148 domain-containing protein [Caballeronia mineralivorans]
MSRRTLLKQSVLATLLLSAAAAAFAGGGGGSNGFGRNQFRYPSSASGPRTVARIAPSPSTASTDPKPSPTNAGWAPATNGNTGLGKTRAQVRAELLQAEEAGVIPTLNAEYPPSADTIARNRAHFQKTQQARVGWTLAPSASPLTPFIRFAASAR